MKFVGKKLVWRFITLTGKRPGPGYMPLLSPGINKTHTSFLCTLHSTQTLSLANSQRRKNSKIENQKSKILNLLTNLLKTSKLKIPYFVDSVLKRRD